MSFLKKITSNSKAMDKIADMGGKYIEKAMGGSNSSATTSTEKANEQWSAHSTGTGKKRALFIGINYHGQKGELRGCINDVENIRRFVQTRFNFPTSDMRTLVDTQGTPANDQPTRANIIAAMEWLVKGAVAGDSLFLHYSGHGSQQEDKDKDEGDGIDETICPVDYSKSGMISDDDMHVIMLKNLPAGVKFVSIFDCCHSGSILDLPFTYTVDGNLEIVEVDNRVAAAKKFLKAGLAYGSGNQKEAMRGLMDGIKTLTTKDGSTSGGAVNKDKVDEKCTAADVVQFSGCQDHQTSADATIQGNATGAMSHAFIKAMDGNTSMTYKDLLQKTREILKGEYKQIPQLSAGRRLDMNVHFQL